MSPTVAQTRYEIREALGRGGMGVVYKAFDTVMKREVALKTLLDIQDRAALDLFYKEWGILASIVHPNIVEIYDIGEMEHEGRVRPYFVMPLLPGRTLDRLIKDSSHRLTVERSVEIISQTCRGLQVAHERGLVHRDLKPSNIFVMVDDSVKIIDFGVVHLVDAHSTGLKGTLAYMSPEQVQMKPPSPASDIFSLGVIAYETLTLRRPFTGTTETEVARNILQQIPPPVSEITPAVCQAISQVVHKAMAKQSWHRFASAREFGETLQKALHNQPIECFDAARVRPRLEKASAAFEAAEIEFASEVLAELEAEGHIDPEIATLRRRIDQTLRQSTIRQLLESARRCFQDQEYPLALRKIQEALQLDPEHADALALKGRVEQERREKKADEWLQLAREHLENCSFTHARTALHSLLELKSGDTQALQLLAEVDRREQEHLRIRQEKAQLHQAALDHWQKGEVSSALSKLERLVELEHRAPDIDPKHSATFQKLYNEVRSEHDAIRNGYETARTALASDNVAQATAICDEYLAKYPGHALFQALKYDAEDRQRQKLSALIAETDRKVEEEPDLDRRLSILEEVLRLFPGEPHFERAIRLVRDKRELVNSIVSRARMHEERGQFNEALDQWKILRTIHTRYPGLDFEIERLVKRRDQQARTDAKTDWVQQIDRHVESGDYERAIECARSALADFPGDAELTELLNLATRAAERSGEAILLLDRFREHWAGNRFDEAFAVLRKARQIDPRNSVVRAVLVDALLQRARAVIEADANAAEELVKEALELDPNSAPAKSLRTQIDDHKQNQYVAWCTTQARRLQAAGEVENARVIVEQGLASYPKDPRLLQAHGTLSRAAQDAPPVQPRTREFDELQRILERLKTAAELSTAQLDALAAMVRSLDVQYADDPEVQALVEAIQQILADRCALQAVSTPGPPISAAPQSPAETSFRSAAGRILERILERVRPTAAKAVSATQEYAGKLRALVRQIPANQSVALAVVAALAVGILLGGFAVRLILRKHPPIRVAAASIVVPVEITTTPPGAVIRINDEVRGYANLKIGLAPGKYQLRATLDGYSPELFEFSAKPGAAVPVNLVLRPLPPVLRLFTDLDSAAILLDDRPAGDLQNGELTLNEVPAGSHTLKLSGKAGEASLPFTFQAGGIPVLSMPLEAKELAATAVAAYGGTIRMQCKCDPGKAALDGNRATTVSQFEAEWTGIPDGAHDLTAGEGPAAHKMVVETGGAPSLTLFVKSERNVGTLVITAEADDATVFINDRKLPRSLQNGRFRVPNLAVGPATVRISKDGFEPATQQVEIRKGEESRLEFRLRPRTASLTLEGAPAGAQLLIDGTPAGDVQPDGSFTAPVSPGIHTLELRKSGFKPRIFQKEFPAGAGVRLAAAETALQSATGSLRLRVTPAGASVSLRRDGEPATPARTLTEGTTVLPEGRYILSASAPGYAGFTGNLEIAPGVVHPFEVQLKPLSAPAAAPVSAAPKQPPSDWDASVRWVTQGAWMVKQGGDFIPFRANPTAGRFAFSLTLRKGKRLRWVLSRVDDRNYALFELDKKYFYRSQVVDGKTTELAKVLHRAGETGTYSLIVEVTQHGIAHSIRIGQAWSPLDSWQDPTRDFPAGRFGFFIPGRDEIGLADFSFTPR
jgi:serine/threonine protein kinase